MMWKLILYCFLLREAGSSVLTHQVDIQYGGSVTLSCMDSKYKDIPAEVLDVQWWTGEHLVIQFRFGRVTQGRGFINRTHLSTEGLTKGDFSLSITHTQYSDSGPYQCVLVKEGRRITLGDVNLEVKVDRPRALFIKSGDGVILPCFGRVDWLGSEAAFVQWKRGGQVVIQWRNGSLYVHMMFEGRASVLRERIKHGDISLSLNVTHLDDQGVYLCFFKKNGDIRPEAIINLTVTEHLSRVSADSGSQFQLPLPDVSAVRVTFLPDGGNVTESVCDVERHLLTCIGSYTSRTRLNNRSLILTNITPADSGTFILMDKQTTSTRSVVIVQIFSSGTKKVIFDGYIISLVVGLVAATGIIVALSVYFCCKRRNIRRSMERNNEMISEKETGINLLQPSEVVTDGDTSSSQKHSVIEL